MDHALRVDHHLDALGRHREQPARLDGLEALVHHRRGVDRDLAAHAPGGMRAGLVGRDAVQRLQRAVQERPARGGEHQPLHARAAGRRARQALEDRVVLAVQRQQRGAVRGHRAHEQRAGHHERLLVRQQDLLARARRRQRRQQPRRTDDGRHHRVAARRLRDLAQRLRAVHDLGAQAGRAQPRLQLHGAWRIADHRDLGAEGDAVREELVEVAVRRQRMHREAVGVARHEVERAVADRPGGTEQGEALRGHGGAFRRQRSARRARAKTASSTHRAAHSPRHRRRSARPRRSRPAA
ncbi:hypothetical protein D3C86_1164780 [compost metagenome]